MSRAHVAAATGAAALCPLHSRSSAGRTRRLWEPDPGTTGPGGPQPLTGASSVHPPAIALPDALSALCGRCLPSKGLAQWGRGVEGGPGACTSVAPSLVHPMGGHGCCLLPPREREEDQVAAGKAGPRSSSRGGAPGPSSQPLSLRAQTGLQVQVPAVPAQPSPAEAGALCRHPRPVCSPHGRHRRGRKGHERPSAVRPPTVRQNGNQVDGNKQSAGRSIPPTSHAPRRTATGRLAGHARSKGLACRREGGEAGRASWPQPCPCWQHSPGGDGGTGTPVRPLGRVPVPPGLDAPNSRSQVL